MTDPSKYETESNTWKNPSEVIEKKSRLNKRKSILSFSSSLQQFSIDGKRSDESLLRSSTSQDTFLRNKNPFKQIAPKRLLKQKSLSYKNDISDFQLEIDFNEDSNALHEFPDSVFNAIRKPLSTKWIESSGCSSSNIRTNKRSLPIDFSCIDEFVTSLPKQNVEKVDVVKTEVDSLPIDFRLGVKLRLESSEQFFWLEDSGVSKFDEAIDLFCSLPTKSTKYFGDEAIVFGNEIFQEDLERNEFASDCGKFLACTLYWQFPDIAWQPSFPRLSQESRLLTKNASIPNLYAVGDQPVHALTVQWFSSFEQLYLSWRYGKRPYFYVCCPSSTILFWKTAKGIIEFDENTGREDNDYNFRVVITPTLYGFRQQLREEGIRYLMPFRNARRSSSLRSLCLTDNSGLDLNQSQQSLTACNKKEQSVVSSNSALSEKNFSLDSEDESKENQFTVNNTFEKEENGDMDNPSFDDLHSSNDTDNDEWLRGIGISPRKNLKITRKNSVMSCRSFEHEYSLSLHPDAVDENKKSAIVLRDLNSITALYNLMTTTNFGRVATGPQAGLPPTLLARQPFLHSVLKN
ncbi:unnamed protein product, partial [Thelazia callipaeda]|uniref:Uncharacterized protein n=1 Tax=Thelazia callipaeda TaxID=103827 RepID=A0A0N5CR32_THECL